MLRIRISFFIEMAVLFQLSLSNAAVGYLPVCYKNANFNLKQNCNLQNVITDG